MAGGQGVQPPNTRTAGDAGAGRGDPCRCGAGVIDLLRWPRYLVYTGDLVRKTRLKRLVARVTQPGEPILVVSTCRKSISERSTANLLAVPVAGQLHR